MRLGVVKDNVYLMVYLFAWLLCFWMQHHWGSSAIISFSIPWKIELLLLLLSASYVLHLFFCCSKWHVGSVQAGVLISQNIPSWDVGSGTCEYETTLKCTSGLHCLSVNLCSCLYFMDYKSAVILDFSCFLWLEAHSKCFHGWGFSLGLIHLLGKNSDASNGRDSWQLRFFVGFDFSLSQHVQWEPGKRGTEAEDLKECCIHVVACLTKYIKM